MLLVIMIVLVIVALGGGGWGHTRGYGLAGWSPLGIILVVVLFLYLFGHLRF